MKLLAGPSPVPTVVDADYKRLLRWPVDEPWSEPVAERVAWAQRWFAAHARPWWAATVVPARLDADDAVVLDGTVFWSRALARRLRGCGAAIVTVVSAGPEAEAETRRRWAAGEPDHAYFLDRYAAAVVEALQHQLRGRLCTWAEATERALRAHLSPGYPGWAIDGQVPLAQLLTRRVSLPGPLEVLPSGMPRPQASQLAVFGLAPAADPLAVDPEEQPCRRCPLERCELRRQPAAREVLA